MLELITEAFELEFQRRALVGASLAVVASSIVGTWVVLRGMAFMADALAHGVIPGIAIALLLGISPFIGALAAAVIMALAIGLTTQKTAVSEDTATGLLFVGMLAGGVVLISRSQGFQAELTSLLFGDVLGVSTEDIVVQLIAAVIVLIVTIVLFRPFMALTYNPVKAQTLGMAPKIAQLGMMTLLALSIVASFQTVGTLLVFGLLVGPPATALQLVRRVPAMMIVSIGFGLLAAFLGLLISFHASTAGGATIAGIAVLQFFIVSGVKALFNLRSAV